MPEINSQSFTPEDVEKKTDVAFLQHLLELSDQLDGRFLDIHITSDGYCRIIEWADVSFDYGGGRFEFVDEDEAVMEEVGFPDAHYEYVPKGEGKEALSDWLRDNPSWSQSEFGGWVREDVPSEDHGQAGPAGE